MARQLYELTGAADLRFSPYCWRTRMALVHKGLEAERIPCRFTDKALIAFSGQEKVPVLVDGERTISDSWAIACYLEDAYPDAPALFGGDAARATTRFVNTWADTRLGPALLRVVLPAIVDHHLDPADHDYFVTTRERRFGLSVAAIRAQRDDAVAAVLRELTPLRQLLQDQPWISGAAPAYADYSVAGMLQWQRLVDGDALLADEPRIREWRDAVLERV
ncbi:glutathione S-transferase N-terminal domain-containing protein [Aquisalimonas asiatica]|uniref:Glutathione S-transferase n=1 Tax=Aquisalimonas asiatica TaxID=406100 RepID=A0A1H8TGP8_9GAMM|nr:glutathione S-transferase N-terminal domain-containing protein [Aquisalimonas asiatica]SEO90001.1 Glutathione S-transferase [Aquisalimonas asiatica]